jgi:hypothetical protein
VEQSHSITLGLDLVWNIPAAMAPNQQQTIEQGMEEQCL